MKKKYILILMFLFSPFIGLLNSIAQENKFNHWETLFYPDQKLIYFSPPAPIDNNWVNIDFKDTVDWKTGGNILITSEYNSFFGGQGYKILPSMTVYTRTHFQIKDTSVIGQLQLMLDYSDGFVAYINGMEVARENIGIKGVRPAFDQKADSSHVFELAIRESFSGLNIGIEVLSKCLRNGDNVLAVELHNNSADDKLMGYFVFLFAGMNTETVTYYDAYPYFPFPVKLDSTKLPIILINTPDNQYIPDNPRVTANMKIIDKGPGKMNYITSNEFTYNGKITIERRGSSSQMFPKHSYGFSTVDDQGKKNNVELMGFSKEHDWILRGEYSDRTLIRDVLTYKLSRDMKRYASRTRFCEVFINDVNMGLFTLMEKIKRDSLRVDISEITVTDNANDQLTGGYILKLDKTTGSKGPGWTSKYPCPNQKSVKPYFQYEYPKPESITTEQKDYIKNFINQFEDVLRSDNFRDPDNGYRKYIDVESFIDNLILQEVGRNVDGYRLSTYMYKEKDSKGGQLHMGPLWDFNLAYGYSGILCNGKWADVYEGWAYDYNVVCPGDSYYLPFWWDRLLQDSYFTDKLKSRWDKLRNGILHKDSIMNFIDKTVKEIDPAQKRNFNIWQNLFTNFVWPNDPKTKSYSEEVTYLKDFITNRLNWLDKNIPEKHEVIIYETNTGINKTGSHNSIFQVIAFPNPFKNNFTIKYTLNSPGNVKLSIYNLTGQLVKKIDRLNSIHGENELTWDGSSSTAQTADPGVYFYTLEIENKVVVKSKVVKY